MVYKTLNIQAGITAIIGGGGKTTLMGVLARELSSLGTVLVTTSTHIFPMSKMPVLSDATETAIARQISLENPICIGSTAKLGKLAAPTVPFYRLAMLADYVLVEADGSKGLPLKAHLPYEPVIPPNTNQVIYVVGASAVGQAVEECTHRPHLYAALAGCSIHDTVTPETVCRVLQREALHTRVLVNQVHTPAQQQFANKIAKELPCPVAAGSLQEGTITCLL